VQEILNSIFKAYDVRGKVGSELTPEVVTAIGAAMAEWLPTEGMVAVGRDMRPDSAELAAAITKGLKEQGRNVMDIGEVTSDMIYFAVGHFGLAGGVMITASHNPGEYNGIKLCGEGAKPIGEETGLYEIRDRAKSPFTPTKKQGTVEEKDIVEDWIQHVLSFVEDIELKPLKIAVDAGNGMAGKIFPELEPYVPFEVHEMYFDLDGTFPNHIANPLEPKNLVDLQKEVRDHSLDLGIAFDGDGDRAVLVDHKGDAVTGTVMTAILAEYFLSLHPGATILHNAICGRAAVEAILSGGGVPVRTRVGHSFIKNDMRTYRAMFAGEHSGHYYFQDNYMADSGLIAAIIALGVISRNGKKLADLAGPFRQAYLQINETNFEVTNKDEKMAEVAAAFPDIKADWLDGLTLNFPDSWVNVRPSNTEPLLRLNAEAKSKTELDKLVAQVTRIIES